jgi:hypothetical protein
MFVRKGKRCGKRFDKRLESGGDTAAYLGKPQLAR